MLRGWSVTATVIGVALQLAGLALDAWLHACDATLAAREGIFTLSNPGHGLFSAGLALAALGVGTALSVPLLRRSGRFGVAGPVPSALAGIAVLALLVGGFGVAARGSGHMHHSADMEGHQHAEAAPITWERLREIDALLTTAKEATEKYQDANLARADGYQPVTPVLFALAAHWVNQDILDAGVFDVTRPQVLLYDYDATGGFELVGVSWALPKRSDDQPPPPFFAPLAIWHEHDSFAGCVTARPDRRPVAVDLSEADCRAAGNIFFRERFWYIHVWLHRPSPDGVFSHRNSAID